MLLTREVKTVEREYCERVSESSLEKRKGTITRNGTPAQETQVIRILKHFVANTGTFVDEFHLVTRKPAATEMKFIEKRGSDRQTKIREIIRKNLPTTTTLK